MLEIFFVILLLILISKFIEDKTAIPFVLIVIVLAYIANHFFDMSILGENFEEILYMMLPVILIPDVLGISRSELKKNGGAIFYLAFVAVIISIVLAVTFFYFVQTRHHVSVAELLILLTPLMATDVVSVSAIFSKFKLPSKLKLLAEGESLFNDITSMVIFFFVAIPILNGEALSMSTLASNMLLTIALSAIIGLITGFVGYEIFKISSETFEEFIAIYLMASASFLLADHYKLSGILAVVISILVFKFLFDKEGFYKKKNYHAIIKYLNKKSSSESSFRAYKKESYYLGLFANAVIFISIANVIDIDLLLHYKFEIFYIFAVTTIVRYLIMLPLMQYKKLSVLWINILSLSGMKGGLALIMVVALPDTFEYKEMFLAIVLGVVILSIFVYTIVLMIYMYFIKDKLIIDKAKEHHIVFKDMKNLLEKEEETGAYNEIVFEDLVEKEIKRVQRYQDTFTVVAFKAEDDFLKKIDFYTLRSSDYFGKLDENIYAILLPHSNVKDAEDFIHKFGDALQHIAIAQYATGDTIDILYDKLYSALEGQDKVTIEI